MYKSIKKYTLYFLILVYVSGAIGFLINPVFFKPFTPFTLLLTCLVFLIYQPIHQKNYLVSFVIAAFFGFVCEVIGTKTGCVFGNYYYGNVLGYKVLAVPLVVSLNWALLINASTLMSGYFFKDKIKIAFLSAAMTTLTDGLIEQLAPALDFWYFTPGLAGFHNYAAWFVISFLLSWFFSDAFVKGDRKIATVIMVLQVFFFGLIYLFKNSKFV